MKSNLPAFRRIFIYIYIYGNGKVTGGDNNTEPLDATPTRFDTMYFRSLMKSEGLLHSDQELFKGDDSKSDKLVQLYSTTHNLNFT
jgi:hypothetical protein